jgi:hypothetical protein
VTAQEIIDTLVKAGITNTYAIRDELADRKGLLRFGITDAHEKAVALAYVLTRTGKARLPYEGSNGVIISADLSTASAPVWVSHDGGQTFRPTTIITDDCGANELDLVNVVDEWLESEPSWKP